MYVVTLPVAIFLIIFNNISFLEKGFKGFGVMMFFLYLSVCGLCLFIIVRIKSLPTILIKIDENNILYLYSGVKVNVMNITDVSYKLAHGRGISYRWGKLSIFTTNEKYTIPYMADVEDVGKSLLLLSQRLKIEENISVL